MTRVGEGAVCMRAVAKGYELVFNVQSRRWGGLAAMAARVIIVLFDWDNVCLLSSHYFP